MNDETAPVTARDAASPPAAGDETQAAIYGISDGGITGVHAPARSFAALVGPATGEEFNRLVAPLRPCACWRVDDMRFEFDSSFVLPEISEELRLLSRLRQAHPDSPLSLFAHADPVGNDDYNKALSGRRATAIYALLTRNTELWERLYQQPLGRDRWGRPALQIMLDTLAEPDEDDTEEDADTDSQAGKGDGASFQKTPWMGLVENEEERAAPAVDPSSPEDKQEPSDADDPARAANDSPDPVAPYEADPAQRQRLYLAYMDRLAGPALELSAEDFLGRGSDAGGKGDYQGCGEFNPVRLFSQAENEAYAAAKDKTERNLENAPNRRVVIYLFAPGSRVDPTLWPCPRANEGAAGCRARFWSDGAQRRANTDERREYSETGDTFACRFYDRLARESPCEAAPDPIHIRLYDLEENFIAHAPFRLLPEGAEARRGRANAGGFISTRTTAGLTEAQIEWGFPPVPGQKPAYVFSDDIFLNVEESDPDARAARQLTNLGYTQEAPLADKVFSFQEDYQERFGLEVTGQLDAPTRDAIESVHDRTADNLRTGQGESADV